MRSLMWLSVAAFLGLCACGSDGGSGSVPGDGTAGSAGNGSGDGGSGGTSDGTGGSGTAGDATGGSGTGGSGTGGSGTGGSGNASGYVPDDPPALGNGTKYYVSPSGSDSADGKSEATAWKTLAKVNATSFAPGDSILFEGGQTFAGKLDLGADDAGSAAAPVTVTSYGTGKACIDGGTGDGLMVYNAGGVQIVNLCVRGGWNGQTQSGNDGNGLMFYSDLNGASKLEHVIIDRVDVSGFKKGGIIIGAWPADKSKSGYKKIRITNSDSHGNGENGISSYGYWDASSTAYAHQDLVVRGCKAYANLGVSKTTGHSGSGIVLGDVDGAVIEYSVAYGNGEKNIYSGGGPVGIWAWDSNNVTIQFNEAYGNKTGTRDGGGFDLDGGVTNSVMQYNYSHDNEGPGYLIAQFTGARPMKNLVFRYNISQNDSHDEDTGAFNFWNGGSGIENVDVYHNTVYVSRGTKTTSAVNFMSATRNVRLINNVFITTDSMPVVRLGSGHTGMVVAGNSYFTVGGSATAPAADTSAVVGDPKLLNPGAAEILPGLGALSALSPFYELAADSPLLDQGVPLSEYSINNGGRDLFGNTAPRGSAPDIGAHERQ